MSSARPGRGGDQVIPRPPNWERSDETPWPAGSTWSTETLLASASLQPYEVHPTFDDARVSAVLIALADGPAGPEVLLTRRSRQLRNHAGEISFPGGRLDPGETPVDTACREAYEEVGLDPQSPIIVGELHHLNTIVSRSYIVPVVSHLADRPNLEPLTGEVDRVLWTPISSLTAPGVYHEERWGTPPLQRPLHFFDLDDETVWGATAHMLVELLTRAPVDR